MVRQRCDTCLHEKLLLWLEPCGSCNLSTHDHWTPKVTEPLRDCNTCTHHHQGYRNGATWIGMNLVQHAACDECIKSPTLPHWKQDEKLK